MLYFLSKLHDPSLSYDHLIFYCFWNEDLALVLTILWEWVLLYLDHYTFYLFFLGFLLSFSTLMYAYFQSQVQIPNCKKSFSDHFTFEAYPWVSCNFYLYSCLLLYYAWFSSLCAVWLITNNKAPPPPKSGHYFRLLWFCSRGYSTNPSTGF